MVGLIIGASLNVILALVISIFLIKAIKNKEDWWYVAVLAILVTFNLAGSMFNLNQLTAYLPSAETEVVVDPTLTGQFEVFEYADGGIFLIGPGDVSHWLNVDDELVEFISSAQSVDVTSRVITRFPRVRSLGLETIQSEITFLINGEERTFHGSKVTYVM